MKIRKNELFRRNRAIYVFIDFVIKIFFFRMNYDDFNANHFARKRIEKTIRAKYY